jgi:polysaccharide export outer membrane protein
MNRRSALLLVLGASLSASACTTARYDGQVATQWASASYTLASGDKLRIIVFGQETLSNIYAVDGAGRISMPLIGPVQVAGRSTAEAAHAIEAKLRAGFLREPRVTVEVDAYRPFFVLGEVTTSGQFPFVNGMTVQTAVAIAGGFTPRAQRGSAEITRQTPQGPITATVPVTYAVRPGDTIVIGERWF